MSHQRPCPVCGCDDATSGFAAHREKLEPGDPDDRFDYLQCSGCESYFIAELPSQELLASYYENDSYHTQGDDDATVELSRIRSFYYRLIHPLATRGRLLDIGCGPGLFLEYARARGYEALGAEFSESSARAARHRGFEVHRLDALDEIGAQSIDLISMIHVLEHLEKPSDVIGQAGRLLRPGGQLVIEIPTLHNWEFGVFGARHGGIQAPIHLQFFSERGLRQLAGAHQLELVGATNNYLNTLLGMSLLNLGLGDRLSWRTRIKVNQAMIPLVAPIHYLQARLGIPSSMRVYRFTRGG
ncbi:MAG: class I SAM-dependent methyltransferase [Deltaproteobacteria bacterium]|nr:class I SAM-dependent methyltransferase [Deltaproteobacteria bacterium]